MPRGSFMEIIIRGKPKNLDKKIVRKAVKFYADTLMSSRLHKNIHLTLTFGKLKDGDKGYCDTHYEGLQVRVFDIKIDKTLSDYEILKTLAHEMVHLKQYAKDEHYNYDRNPARHRFKGEIYEIHNEDKEYWLSPWEVEAYGSEYGLFRAFKDTQPDLEIIGDIEE